MIETQLPRKPVVWSISASVAGGGSGIQADLLTFHDFKTHGCTVVTAINAQNSFAQGYSLATERKNIVAQINALDSDMQAHVIKVGVLPNPETIETVGKYLRDYRGFVIFDPELDSNGNSIIDQASEQLQEALFPRLDLLIVNIDEAKSLLRGQIPAIDSPEAIEFAAKLLVEMGPKSVLITGAHFDFAEGSRFDYCFTADGSVWIKIDALATSNNRGGGSILSAAIAAAIAGGETLLEALVLAKAYVTQGIRGSIPIGGGPGAVAHLGWPSDEADKPEVSTTRPNQ